MKITRNHLRRIESLEARAPFNVSVWVARDKGKGEFSQLSNQQLQEVVAYCDAQLVKDYGAEIAAKISAFEDTATDEELRAIAQGKPCPAYDALFTQ